MRKLRSALGIWQKQGFPTWSMARREGSSLDMLITLAVRAGMAWNRQLAGLNFLMILMNIGGKKLFAEIIITLDKTVMKIAKMGEEPSKILNTGSLFHSEKD
ncbi:MAG: hypothetical protein MZV65_15105 [Chromatiales bacterium]|nr:hypothetical protein [Chromatiales bacterium]